MSLVINHNLAAQDAYRNLNATNNALQKSMEKLSSGFRINRGADDPAGLVISEQFRAQIAGLNRAIMNSEGSISMIQTAEGAITEINNLLVSMRELAIHAANEGFNDADQLAADQAEIKNAISTIDRIAANTQFGTKKLLDGSKENVAAITTSNTSGVTVMSSGLSTGTYSLTAVKTADATATLNTTAYGISLANTDGDPTNIAEGISNIDVIQASDVATKTSASVGVTDAWGNGLEVAAAGEVASIRMGAGQFTTAVAGNAGTYNLVINYQDQETNNGTPTGNQTISFAIAATDTSADIESAIEAAIAANTALAGNVTVRLSHDGGNTALLLDTVNAGAQYSLKTEASSTNATTALFTFGSTDDRGASTGALSFTTNTAAAGLLTAEVVTVANATYSNMADLVTAMNTAIAAASYASSTSDITAAAGDNNTISIQTVDEGSTYSIQHLAGTGVTSDLSRVLGLSVDAQAATGVDALVNFDGYTNAITDVKASATGTFTLKSAVDNDPDQATLSIILGKAAAATDGIGIQTGNMLATITGTKFSVQLNGGPAAQTTAGQDATIYSADRNEWVTVNYALDSNGGNETISNTDQSLVFQIGANVGQTASISLRNMSASALAKNLTGNMFGNLSAIDVTTVQGAQDAQAIIDASINEVSTTRGTLGSFQKNTLESNLSNLRIAAQNLTASESQIRDTDMAQEMSEFTKNQILIQAGTAMLAQANQSSQIILQLFQ